MKILSKRRGVQSFFLMGIFSICFSASVMASSVTLNVFSGTDSGFGFSTVHAATGACNTINARDYCMNGANVISQISGTLVADLTGNKLTFNGGAGTLNGTGGSIEITGGSIDFTGATGSSGNLLGMISYLLGGAAASYGSGAFYFYDESFTGTGGPNSLTNGTLSLWGNNSNDANSSGTLGLDLRASVVPLPGALWLFGSGLAALGALRRKSKNRPLSAA